MGGNVYTTLGVLFEELRYSVSVIRTSLGIAYNVLITGISDRMDIAYKNTLGSRKYVRITYIHCVCVMRTVFRRWFLYPVCFYERYSLSKNMFL